MESKMNIEIEKVWFGKIEDMSQLKKAKEIIFIEQWDIKTRGDIPRSDCVRVRNYNHKEYELTIKKDLRPTGKDGSIEKKVKVDKETFETFKMIAIAGVIKERHIFPLDNHLTWEVDVFQDIHGKKYDWCKIDLELPSSYLAGKSSDDVNIKAPFPITLSEVIDGIKRTPEANNFIQNELYKKRFFVYNPNSILPVEEGFKV